MATTNPKDIAALLKEEAEAIEADPDAPITKSKVTRGHGRSETLQVRLNHDELEELERIAATQGLPTSTMARGAILRMIRPEGTRSVAARRLVEEFARYIDTIGDANVSPSVAKHAERPRVATIDEERLLAEIYRDHTRLVGRLEDAALAARASCSNLEAFNSNLEAFNREVHRLIAQSQAEAVASFDALQKQIGELSVDVRALVKELAGRQRA